MITGLISDLEAYKKQLPPLIYDCLKEAADFSFDEREDGKYKICGCDMSVESPVTEPAEQRKPEGHKKFIDIQIEVHGTEKIRITPLSKAEKEIEAHEERDLYFYQVSAKEESEIHMEDGSFAVFFPEDLHRPLCMAGKEPVRLRKAVIKVPAERV